MKTRRSNYRSEVDIKFLNKKIKKRNRKILPTRKDNVDKKKWRRGRSVQKSASNSKAYRLAHEVGRRKSSHFVTYTQNGRLFYDLYVRDSPCQLNKMNKAYPFRSFGESVNVSKSHSADNLPIVRSVRKNESGSGSSEFALSRNREASANASVKLSLLAESSKSSRRKSIKKTVAKSSSKDRRKILLQKKLNRELGVTDISYDLTHGKRLASLNALAIMNAVTTEYKRRASKSLTKDKSQKLQKLSNNVVLSLNVTIPTNQDVDDATTIPMCSTPDVQSPIILSPKLSEISEHVVPSYQTQDGNFNYSVARFNEIHPTNPAIESFRSQRIFPLGGDTYGLQQITHQFVVVSSSYSSSTTSGSFPLLPGTNVLFPYVLPVNHFNQIHLPKGGSTIDDYSSWHVRTSHIPRSPSTYPSNPALTHGSWQQHLVGCIPNHSLPSPYMPYPIQTLILPSVTTPMYSHQPIGLSSQAFQTQLAYPVFIQAVPAIPNSFTSNRAPVGFLSPTFCQTPWTPTSMPFYPNVNPALPAPYEYHSPTIFRPSVSGHTTSHFNSCTPTSCLPSIVLCNGDLSNQSRQTFIESDKKTSGSSTTSQLSNFNNGGGERCTAKASISSTSLEEIVDNCNSVNNCVKRTCENNFPSDKSCNDVLGPLLHHNETGTSIQSVDLSETSKQANNIKSDDTWVWEGISSEKLVFCQGDSSPVPRKCYPAIRHEGDGIIIREKDSVLLCSGPNRSHPPHVAKITALYSDPITDTKMMSLLWYYRPEHLTLTAHNGFVKNELYASRHRDINPVDCIEDKAYVLTVNAYARYMAKLKYQQSLYPRKPLSSVVPYSFNCGMHNLDSTDQANDDVATNLDSLRMCASIECDKCLDQTNSCNVFFCRGLYDYKLKRVSRCPQFCTQSMSISNRFSGKSNVQLLPDCESNIHNSSEHLRVPISTTVPSVGSKRRSCTIGNLSTTSSLLQLNATNKSNSMIHPTASVILEDNSPTKVALAFSSASCTSFLISSDNIPFSASSPLHNSAHYITKDNEIFDYADLSATPTRKTVRISQSSTLLPSRRVESVMTSIGNPVSNTTSVELMVTQKISPITTDSVCLSVNTTQPIMTNTKSLTTASSQASSDALNVPTCSVLLSVKNAQYLACATSNSVGTNSSFNGPKSSSHPTAQSNWLTPTNYDRSMLETSADLSVNWAEHGEQIALSLDCRFKDSNSCRENSCLDYVDNPRTSNRSLECPKSLVELNSNHNLVYPALCTKRPESDSLGFVIL